MECYFCGSRDIAFLTDRGDKFTIEKSNICLNCGLAFLDPRMSDSDLSAYYLTDSFSSDFRLEKSPSAEKREKNRARAAAQWNTIKELAPDSGKLLEIGCSSGEFLGMAPKGYDVYGVDPSTGFARSQETARADVRIGYFPEESFQDEVDKFDIITMFHTLEHVSDPKKILQGVYDRLTNDGTFVIEYPDLSRASIRPRILETYFQKSHLYDFSLFNLAPVLEEIGFSVEYYAFYEHFPWDKNAILLCRKTTPQRVYSFDPVQAKDLYDRILLKFRRVALLRNAPLKVVHFASHNINVGDGAITAGIRQIMGELCSSKVEFTNLDIVDYAYGGKDIKADDIKQYKPDLVLVGGGGTIDGHNTRTFTGTAFTMSPDEMLKTNTKFGFVALGHNAFRLQGFLHKDVLSNFIDFCHNSNYPFSVRMDRSFERLETLLDRDLSELVRRVPDPGFFVPRYDKEVPFFGPWERKRVVIQMALDAYAHRFGAGSIDDFDASVVSDFFKTLGECITEIIKKHDADITIATHTLDDVSSASLILSNLENKMRRMFVRVTPVVHPIYAPMFFKVYSDADLAIGMRGHSVICPMGMGTPTIAIATHDKIDGFMSEVGGNKWSISPLENDFADKLMELSGELLNDPVGQRTIVDANTANWGAILRDFFIECLKDIA